MKKHCILSFLLLLGVWLFGQQAISSSGKQSENSTAKVSWAIGQPFSKTIGNSNHNLTQGVLQPNLEVSSINQVFSHNINVKAYPNPTSQFIELEVTNNDGKQLKYELIDIIGKVQLSKTFSSSKIIIETIELIPSTYILKVYENQTQIHTFKIIKK